jgi:hypothetical protein
LPVDVRVLPRRLTLVVGMAKTNPAGKMTDTARL